LINAEATARDSTLEKLVRTIQSHPRLVALTGAGVSAASGIPTYRNEEGEWQRSDPIQHQEFVLDPSKRQRYWARSMAGWRFVANAQPNPAHRALAVLEQLGYIRLLVTQNVDRLHQRAGHQNVIDLHGRVDLVICLACSTTVSRAAMQMELEKLNPDLSGQQALVRPDGDADLEEHLLKAFRVPVCKNCQGTLMPDVVFFGGSVPRDRISSVYDAIHDADAFIVTGSSLMVYSGFRFCRLAKELGKPVIILNQGRTRADDIADLKISGDCTRILPKLAERLSAI
jgi:NAD-dependent SIR2 family protein deacetylase